MTDTAKLGLPLIAAAQAQKHVTLNEALLGLDTLVQLSVLDKDLSSPPGSPQEGDTYIVAAGASGAWAGLEDRVARFEDGQWRSYIPGAGWLAWVIDEDALYRFDGDDWEVAAVGDVQGPASATDGNFALFDGTSGKLLKDEGVVYETGTWTPELAGQDVAGNHTYSTQDATYLRIGDLVLAAYRIQIDTLDTDAEGNVLITGLPFAVVQANAFSAPTPILFLNVTVPGNFVGYEIVVTNSPSPSLNVRYMQDDGVGSSLDIENFAEDGTRMRGLAVYRTS